MSDPWEKIRRPDSGVAWVRRPGSERVPCHYGLSHDGSLVFLVQANKNLADLVTNAPKLAGLEIDFKSFPASGAMGLTISLRLERDREIFGVLCDDLAAAALAHENERQSFLSIMGRLGRWQRLLAHQNAGLLSTEEVRGLMGELVVLGYLLDSREAAPRAVVEAWEGPAKAPQDFRFRNLCLEVKTTSLRGDGTVRISSEYQLHDPARPIILGVVQLKEAGKETSSVSLNQMVVGVASRLDGEALALFEGKLGQAGYIDLPAYDEPKFLWKDPDFFEVRDEFPALRIGNIPSGVSDLRYQLNISDLSSFKLDDVPEFFS